MGVINVINLIYYLCVMNLCVNINVFLLVYWCVLLRKIGYDYGLMIGLKEKNVWKIYLGSV